MDEITGKTLLAWGYKPGGWFGAAIAAADQARRAGADEAEIRAAVDRHLPAPAATLRAAGALAHRLNIAPEDADEIANVAAVEQHMTELMRVPTVRAGAVMPDACPAGSAPGTIPVGGVVAAENAIYPGMHSADIVARSRCPFFATSRRKRRSMPRCGSRISAAAAGRAANSCGRRPICCRPSQTTRSSKTA